MNQLQFEEQTQSLYRLRTSRGKRRSLIDDRDRQLRALDREHTQAYHAYYRRAWVQLTEPYQRGWYRHFELTEATARHRQAMMYMNILTCINNVQLSSRKDFTNVKHRDGRKLRFEREQSLSKMTSIDWKRHGLGHTASALFAWSPEFDRTGRYRSKLVFTQPWRYELKVRPRIITEVQLVDPQLQSRLQEMTNRFERHHLRPRRNKIVQGYSHNGRRRGFATPAAREGRRFRDTPLHRHLGVAADEDFR